MKFIYRPQVRVDLIETTSYYKMIHPKLAMQFINRIKEAKNTIAKNPLAFPVKFKDTQTTLLRQFPYHIHFALKNNNTVIIYAIICAYKNPKDYTNR